jgi:hypothetical protein
MSCLAIEHGVHFAYFMTKHGAVEFGLEGDEQGRLALRGGGFDAMASFTDALVVGHWLFRKNTIL